MKTPSQRIATLNRADLRPDREYVLYWMISARRCRWNFALDRATELASELGKPLLVFEALRSDYPWASDRFHRFVIDGMRDNARALEKSTIGYYPYVEDRQGGGSGLLETLAGRAAAVVTDEFPCFFLPRMVEAAAAKLDVRLESVDSNGLLPLRAADRAFARAYDFRRFLQRELPDHLDQFPRRDRRGGGALPPFSGLPKSVTERWPKADLEDLSRETGLASLPIDHGVAPISQRGGSGAARRALRRFLEEGLDRYDEQRNDPTSTAASELSGYLHFGHLSAHEVFDAIVRREDWTPWQLSDSATGARSGWWNLSSPAEAFLDQLVTWREVGYNFCFHRDDYTEFESLPPWAQETLADHAADERPQVYEPQAFAKASTHDEIWNAAQNELCERGRIHNYLRMLWGKKILHWSNTPRDALNLMIELNNKYAIDGRNPNSYSGIFWVLGRFDRAWGPERPVFGKVRYMSSKNTRRKLKIGPYLERWGAEPRLF